MEDRIKKLINWIIKHRATMTIEALMGGMWESGYSREEIKTAIGKYINDAIPSYN